MSAFEKTCLITGANSGIGKVTALELAKQQARVVMLCRNKQKAEDAHREIVQESGNKDVHILLCDLASQKDIREAAEKFKQKFTSLDILINNAGVILGKERQLTPDGFEKTFATNHLGPFSLSLLLLAPLMQSSEGRIINVSSEAHRYARFDMGDLQLKHRPYNGLKAYSISKLCNIWFTRQLAQYCRHTNLMVNCLHPGFVASNFGRRSSLLSKVFIKLSRPFAVSPEKGAETSLYLAVNDDIRHITGAYFKNKKPVAPSKDALNDHYARELWQQSKALTGLELNKLMPDGFLFAS